jgi:hypothetical protein
MKVGRGPDLGLGVGLLHLVLKFFFMGEEGTHGLEAWAPGFRSRGQRSQNSVARASCLCSAGWKPVATGHSRYRPWAWQ